MTGIAIGAVRTGRPATDAGREAGLRWLAGVWEDHGPERHQMLAAWAHSSLSPDGREELFGYYRATLGLADDLWNCRVPWDSVEPELQCDDRQARAAERKDDEAREWLHALLNGTGER